MERSNLEIVILAAGHGSRMHSSTPKVLHNVAGQALLEYSIKIATDILESYKGTITVVASQELFDNIAFKALQERYFFSTVIQKEKLGTGDAVRAAFIDRVPITSTSILVLYGDTPLLKIETIHAMLASLYGDCGNHLVALGFKSESSSGYGRFILSKDNTLIKIIEAKDCNDDEVNVTICNGGIMAFTSEVLKKFIPQMRNDNKSSEYYLTNIVEFTNQNGYRNCYIVTDRDEILGVNDRSQLSEIEGIVQKRLRAKLLEKGVTLIAPETVFLTETVDIESDVIIHPYVYFGKDVKVKSAAEIFSFSHIEGAIIEEGVRIGPFARIRPTTHLQKGVHIGNFVEVKNAAVGESTKASHLSYLGDVEIGKGVNIGAGTIFCNYDGKAKHKSIVGDSVFIGSNSAIVSPIEIGDDSKIGAGSVITKNIPEKNLAIARAKQSNIPLSHSEENAETNLEA